MISKTLSPDNQLKVRCPVFPAETKIAGCFMLRDLVARGEGPVQRQGCQCAMAAGKCPVPVLLTRMVRTNEDEYHSVEPKVRSFDDRILATIGRVLVGDFIRKRFSLSAQEELTFEKANEAARSFKDGPKPRRAARAVDFEEPAVPDAIVEAAISGDLGAAISTTGEQT